MFAERYVCGLLDDDLRRGFAVAKSYQIGAAGLRAAGRWRFAALGILKDVA
jgi:hypothetical protein